MELDFSKLNGVGFFQVKWNFSSSPKSNRTLIACCAFLTYFHHYEIDLIYIVYRYICVERGALRPN